MTRALVLLVEDNLRIQIANRDMLEIRGYEVMTAMSLMEAWARIAEKAPDIIVLDVMLPDGNGIDFVAELRKTSNIPVLMLTALGTPESTVSGFTAGADDYLSKPYDFKVLAARIEALLRRSKQIPESFKKGPLTFSLLAGQVYLDGESMLLTQKEFACLLLLAQNEGKSLSIEYLYETIWRMPLAGSSQALRTTIARLRGKLAGSGYTIAARRNEGYVFARERTR